MIFVVGNSRSGTTMMGRILGKNMKVHTFHELHFFEQLWSTKDSGRNISREDGIAFFANLISIEREGYLNPNRNRIYFEEEVRNHWQKNEIKSFTKIEIFKEFLNYETSKHQKTIPCDQTPRNLFYVEEILRFFPEAKIIYMVRDPRDVLLSQKNKWKRRFLGATNIPLKEAFRSKINYHPVTISKLWISCAKYMHQFVNHPSVMQIKFEDLLNGPEHITQQICRFANIKFEPEMLLVPHVGSSIAKDEAQTLGINSATAGSYKRGGLTNEEVVICQEITGGSMAEFGYEKLNIDKNIFKKAFLYTTFPVKLGFAFLMNLNRMSNIIESIKRRLK